MLLPDHRIAARIADKSLTVSPYDPARLQPASLDLTLDRFVRIPRMSAYMVIDVADVPADHTVLKEMPEHGWLLHPGDFLLGCTDELVGMPADLAARVEGKSSLGRLGLIVHATAGFIDPGFRGQITLEISNISPWVLRLRPSMPIAQLALIPMAAEPDRLYGQAGNHYQDQVGPVESRYRLP